MVARTAPLPNVRRMFVPDPGHVLADADLRLADLQIVIWESGDVGLKTLLRQGVDLHIVNACELLKVPVPPLDELVEDKHPNYPEHKARYGKQRKFSKRWIHGTDYGGMPRTMAIAAGITVAESERLQARWFAMHPGIKQWHDRTREAVERKREIRNVFGYRRVFFDRGEQVFREALAWTPQSIVGRVINTGLVALDKSVYEPLLHVHDSLVIQFPDTIPVPEAKATIRAAMEVPIPYPDPLTIPVSVKCSATSWGHCE